MKYCVILGTRPEIIKMAPVIRAIESRAEPLLFIHTGQHYSPALDAAVFADFELREPDINLGVGKEGGTLTQQLSRMLASLDEILGQQKHDCVLVQGDTTTVLAGALAASNRGIPLGHVEAGIRSYDLEMPEERYRQMTDRVATYLFAPTPIARENLLSEGIQDERVYVVGNTCVDATLQNVKIARRLSRALDALTSVGVNTERYLLLTMHRAENVDYRERFAPVLEQIAAMATTLNYDVVFPIHPRTKSKIQEFGLDYLIASLGDYRIHAIDPAGPLDMLQLIANAQTVLTDSGGIQEEACILQVPCITLRTTTERPESLAVGANILVGDALRKLSSYPDLLCQYVAQSVSKKRDWTNPFGDGTAAQQIVDICYRQCM